MKVRLRPFEQVELAAGFLRRVELLADDGLRRLAVVWMAPLLMSQAIQRRPSFCATAAVVPEPMKQSRTRSPGLEEALMMRSRRASGF